MAAERLTAVAEAEEKMVEAQNAAAVAEEKLGAAEARAEEAEGWAVEMEGRAAEVCGANAREGTRDGATSRARQSPRAPRHTSHAPMPLPLSRTGLRPCRTPAGVCIARLPASVLRACPRLGRTRGLWFAPKQAAVRGPFVHTPLAARSQLEAEKQSLLTQLDRSRTARGEVCRRPSTA